MNKSHKTVTLRRQQTDGAVLTTGSTALSGTVRRLSGRRGLRRAATTVLAASVASVALVVGAPAAMATPSAGISAKVLWQTTSGGTDYVLREITIAPGGTTGWHYHDGTLYAVVRAGTLTHEASTCRLDGLYPPGSSLSEQSDHVHRGVNIGTVPVVLDVLYVQPAGSPASEDAPDPGCAPLS